MPSLHFGGICCFAFGLLAACSDATGATVATPSSGGIGPDKAAGGSSATSPAGVTGGTGSGGTSGGMPATPVTSGTSAGGAGGNAVSGGAPAGSSGKSGNAGAGNDAGTSSAGGNPTAMNGGSSGTAGSTPKGDCPDALVGWASIAGDNVATTTGGGNTPPVRPRSAAELMEYASDAEPRVIEITSTFDTSRLVIASNKTLLGVGPNATINGGVRIRASGSARVSNVILKNLRINGRTTEVDGDAVQLYRADHVWIDHCEVYDGVDSNLDVVHGSNWITISWSKFRYTSAAPDPEHKFSTLIGHSDDNASEDAGRLNVTLHHNHWAEGVTERMPRVRFGKVHSFNNYFTSSGNNYCLRAGRGGQLLIENNYFQGVSNPHEFNNDEDEPTAHITERGSVYSNTSGLQIRGGGGTPFTSAPYTVTLDAAADVPALVQACVGPR